jgi:hypothetical protein
VDPAVPFVVANAIVIGALYGLLKLIDKFIIFPSITEVFPPTVAVGMVSLSIIVMVIEKGEFEIEGEVALMVKVSFDSTKLSFVVATDIDVLVLPAKIVFVVEIVVKSAVPAVPIVDIKFIVISEL